MAGQANRGKQRRARRSSPGLARAAADGARALRPDPAASARARILPPLALARASAALSVTAPPKAPMAPTDEEVRKLALLALRGDLAGAHALVASLIEQGVSLEVALLLLLAPAARVVQGEWIAEGCSFAEVTAALALIQELVSVLGEPAA